MAAHADLRAATISPELAPVVNPRVALARHGDGE